MKTILMHVLTSGEKEKLKAASEIECANFTNHNCDRCPLYVNVHKGYSRTPEKRCLIILIDQAIELSSFDEILESEDENVGL